MARGIQPAGFPDRCARIPSLAFAAGRDAPVHDRQKIVTIRREGLALMV